MGDGGVDVEVVQRVLRLTADGGSHAVDHHVAIQLQQREGADGERGRVALEARLREVGGEVAEEAADAAHHLLRLHVEGALQEEGAAVHGEERAVFLLLLRGRGGDGANELDRLLVIDWGLANAGRITVGGLLKENLGRCFTGEGTARFVDAVDHILGHFCTRREHRSDLSLQ